MSEGHKHNFTEEEKQEALAQFAAANQAVDESPEFGEYKKNLGLEVGFDTLKQAAIETAKESPKEALAFGGTNALVAGNPLKATPQGFAASILPSLHNYGQGDPMVEAYKQVPAPPNIPLGDSGLQIPIGDAVKGFNNIAFQTMNGGKNMVQDAGRALGGMLQVQPGQYPQDYVGADSKSTAVSPPQFNALIAR
jgi:hypothetical protein